jgi:hypothetical protein
MVGFPVSCLVEKQRIKQKTLKQKAIQRAATVKTRVCLCDDNVVESQQHGVRQPEEYRPS